MNKKAYIIGIAGRTMAGIAKMLKDMEWEVSGVDQNAYPPITTWLEDQGIPYVLGYDAKHISKDLDLVVVGGNAYHVVSPNPEVERARKLGIKVQSYPEFFHEYLEKEESLLVVGTYGKTTICALLAWIMEVGGLNPAFDISEITGNFEAGTRNTDSKYSVIHGDEHPTLGYSELPKFAYFDPKYVILTAAMWDHFNIYPIEESFVKVFKDLTGRIPESGWLLMNSEGSNNEKVAKEARCRVYRYGVGDVKADFVGVDLTPFPSPNRRGGPLPKFGDRKVPLLSGEGLRVRSASRFVFKDRLRNEEFELELPKDFFGRHNMENAVAAVAAARMLGVKIEKMQEAMRGFKGLKRHLELVGKIELGKHPGGGTPLKNINKGDSSGVGRQESGNNILLYHDQGQHPQKTRGAVEALRERYADRKLIVIFDPRASVLHDKESLNWYDHAFSAADEVIIGGMKIRKLKKGESKHDRVTGKRIRNAIAKTQKHVRYLPMNRQIVKYLRENLQGGEVVLFLSTGDFGGLIEEVIEAHG
jgi:UDP-N-acetylmuramate: L-alanyl-gamma-D-glutamyl-meso-diaminopimelate ligase